MMVMEATTAAMYANSSGVTKQQEHQQQQQQDVAAYQQSLPLQSYVQHHHYFLSSPPSSATSSSSSAAVFSASSSSTSPLALTPVWPSSVRGGSYPVGGSSQQPVLRSPSSSSELHQLIQGAGERAVAAAPSAADLTGGCSPYSSLAFYQTDPQLGSMDAHSMFYSPHHQQGQQQYPAVDYGQYMMPYDVAANNSNVYSRSTTMSQQHLMLQRHQYLQHQQQEKMAVSPPSNTKSEVGSGVNQLTMSTLPLPGGRGQQVEGTTRSMTSLVGGVSSGKIHKPPFAWMAKQPAANSAGTGTTGKTRTSDKYRVVYTDLQKVELEKEFLYSKYITIQRKAELARFVNLSERQVKIWFQNRRAKERKSKKHDDVMPASPLGNAHDDADSPSPDHVTEYVLPMKKCSQDDIMLSAAHRLRPDVNHHLFSSYIHGH